MNAVETSSRAHQAMLLPAVSFRQERQALKNNGPMQRPLTHRLTNPSWHNPCTMCMVPVLLCFWCACTQSSAENFSELGLLPSSTLCLFEWLKEDLIQPSISCNCCKLSQPKSGSWGLRAWGLWDDDSVGSSRHPMSPIPLPQRQHQPMELQSPP